MKAKFKKSWYEKNGKYQLKCLEYEYKGNTYCVYMGDTQDTLAEQHKMQQAYIDRIVEVEEKSKTYKPTTSAQEDFDFFWEYVNS